MKKLLLAMLALVMVLGVCAYANPVLDTAEQDETQAVLAEDTALVKGVKPGLNMVGQTSGAWSFEEADGMNNVSLFKGADKVIANPLVDSVNGSATASVASYTVSGYPALTFNLSEELDGARPIYVSFKYYKDYTPAADETGTTGSNLWVMRNDANYVAKSIGGFGFNDAWKSYAELLVFDNAYNASTNEKAPKPVTSILLETKVNENSGKTNVYYDDVLFVPSYKITYMADAENVIDTKYALLDGAGKVITKYYFDKSVEAPVVEGYDFIGWNTSIDATTAVTNVTLANEDIVLYPVYKAQPLKAGWDFETAESQTWGAAYARTYRNGMMILDSATQASGYTGHTAVSFDTSVYKYFVIKARSVDSVDSIKLYFKTTNMEKNTEAATMTIKINPYSDEFTEYVIDMSANADWTGNYTSCMFQLNGGSGIVEFEEIYFASDVEKRAAWVFEGSKQDGIRPWGHSENSYVEDGNLVIVKDTAIDTSGAVDLKPIAYSTNALSNSVDATENPYVVVKSPRGKGPASFQIYYITGEMTGITGSSYVHANKYGSDATHDYYLADFSAKDGYATGMVKAFWLGAAGNGTFYVDEAYVTDRKPAINKASGADFEAGAGSGFRAWGSYTASFADGKAYVEQANSGHGGVYIKPANAIAEENRYFVAKQVNAESVGVPSKLYAVGAYKTGIDENLTVSPYTTSYETPDGVYTYYIFDLINCDKNAKDGVAYTGTIGDCCLTISGGSIVLEDLYFVDDISDIIAECTIDRKLFTAPAEITTEGGSITLAPFVDYKNGWVTDFTYELDNDNATITEKTDGTAVLTAKYNGEVTVTMTANDVPATVITHTVTISGQAPVYTVVYDAGTDDEVTGMPENVTVQTWDTVFTVSDAKPEREGYKFAGWALGKNSPQVLDSCIYMGDTTTMYAIWIDENTGLLHINKGEYFDVIYYVNGFSSNVADCLLFGGSILVPLTDGVGYVLVSDSSGIENAVAYKVTADACEKLDYVPAKTLAGNEARVTGDTGIRFKANIAHAMRNAGNVAEYGFVVSTANQIAGVDSLSLSLVNDGDAVKGVAYSKEDNIDKYVDEDDEGVIMAAVVTGVAASKKNYETTIYVRPYMVLDSGLVVYGMPTGDTYYNIAKAIAENMPEDAPYAEYINGIIATVEAE